jgi:hypothetical protein
MRSKGSFVSFLPLVLFAAMFYQYCRVSVICNNAYKDFFLCLGDEGVGAFVVILV